MLVLQNSNSLRCYPTPYLSYRLDRTQLDFINETVMDLDNRGEIWPYRVRQASIDLASQVAFAMCYDKVSQLRGKKPERLKWDSNVDYYHGPLQIKLFTDEASERFGNTGPTMRLDVPRKTFNRSKADTFVAAVMSMPYIQFLGWFDKEDMLRNMSTWSVLVAPNSKALKPMWELEGLEKTRIAGTYV